MIRLLWKELREKRIWALILAISAIGPIIFGQSYTYLGEFANISGWSWFSILAAALLGTNTYSSEIAKGAVDFLYSRPISWKKILFSKVIAGLVIIIITSLLTAITYKLFVPEQYAKFATMPRLGVGIGQAFLILGYAYMVGIVCSVVLPGILGGVLTFFGLIALFSIEMAVLESYPLDYVYEWVMIGWAFGALIATIMIARFGITLRIPARIVRYLTVVILIVVCTTTIGFVFERPINRILNPMDSNWESISPDGKYALVTATAPYKNRKRYHGTWMVRLSDGKRTIISSTIVGNYALWCKPGMFVAGYEHRIYKIQMDAQGKIHTRKLKLDIGSPILLPSPDCKLMLLASAYRGKHSSTPPPAPPKALRTRALDRANVKLEFVEVDQLRKLPLTIIGARRYWWQSNTKVGYIDLNGNRHIVNVPSALR